MIIHERRSIFAQFGKLNIRGKPKTRAFHCENNISVLYGTCIQFLFRQISLSPEMSHVVCVLSGCLGCCVLCAVCAITNKSFFVLFVCQCNNNSNAIKWVSTMSEIFIIFVFPRFYFGKPKLEPY